jgi:hypothetical protein
MRRSKHVRLALSLNMLLNFGCKFNSCHKWSLNSSSNNSRDKLRTSACMSLLGVQVKLRADMICRPLFCLAHITVPSGCSLLSSCFFFRAMSSYEFGICSMLMNKNLNALKDNLVWTYCTHAFQDSNEISCEMEMYMHQHTFQQSLCKTQYFLPLSVPQTGGRQAVLSFTHRHRIHYEERNQSVYRAGLVFTLWWLPVQEGRILARATWWLANEANQQRYDINLHQSFFSYRALHRSALGILDYRLGGKESTFH